MLLFSFSRNMLYIGRCKNTYVNFRNVGISARQLKPNQFLKQRCSCQFSQNRTLMRLLFKRPNLEQYKLKDNIPEPYTLIYRNRSDRYLLIAQTVTGVSVVGVVMALLVQTFLGNSTDILGTPVSHSEKYVFVTAFVGFCLILQYILYKMPVRIYYWPQQKQYILVFFGKYPGNYKQLRCKVGEVVQLPEKGLSPWKDVKYRIKDQQDVIFVSEYFAKPADLYIMMGLQKDPNVDIPKKSK